MNKIKRSNLKAASGTVREDRFCESLDPAYAPVDERSSADLTAFAVDFSRLVNFYDSSNQPVSDWQPFFARDLSFLLAKILATDFRHDHFQGWALQNAVREGRESTEEILKAIYHMAIRLDDWYRWAEAIAKKERAENPLMTTLRSIIQTDVRHYLGKNIESILKQIQSSRGLETWTSFWAKQEDRLLREIWQVAPGEEQSQTIVKHAEPADGLLAILRALHRANNKLSENAQQYFEDYLTHSDHPPHTGLYLSFIKLLSLLRDKINTITDRHLNFYYHDVLRLKKHESVPDTAHVAFELAPELKSFTLAAGTRLTAGKNATGKLIEYATDQDLFINQARVASLKALYLFRDEGSPAATHNHHTEHDPKHRSAGTATETSRITNIFALPQANSQDGKGEPLVNPELGWPTFGINGAAKDRREVAALDAELGFIVASPILLLQEGQRDVAVTVAFAGDGALETALEEYQRAAAEILDAPVPIEMLLADAFLIYVSGEKDWIPVGNASFRRHPVVGTALTIEFTFTSIDPAVLPNPAIAPLAGGGNEWPLFKLALNPQARVYAYPFFNQLEIETIEFRVSVQGVQKLQLRNELGPLDPAQPFPVFGPVPTQGSYLLLSHPELSVKSVSHVTTTVTWFNLPQPPLSWESYYAQYKLGIHDDTFKVRVSVFGTEKWEATADGPTLFPMFARDFDNAGLLPVSVFPAELPEIPLPAIQRTESKAISEADAPRGSLRLALAKPAFGFGHQVFPAIMADIALKNAKAAKNGKQQPLPNPPLAPVAKTVTLDYDASEKLVLTRPLPANQKAHFYSIYPFGCLAHQGRPTPMFPDFQEQGHLYLGLSNLRPREPVTLLFHLCDTAYSPVPSVRNHHDETLAPIRWRYLAGAEWKNLPGWSMLSDSTMGLTRSGVVKLSLPEDGTSASTLMPAGFCWIEAAAPQISGVYWSRVVSILTQAVSATRVCNLQDPLLPPRVPAGAITQLSQKLPQIKAVRQPFSTRDGRSRESTQEFRVRVSERLRHKDRAIQCLDHEQMILERFPEVGQIKCIGHNNSRFFPGTDPVEPGMLYLVVTPRLEDTNESEPRLPQCVLKMIEEYIRRRTSAFAKDIHVINPVYETLKVFAHVELSREGDSTAYRDELDAALSVYLQPWRPGPGKRMRAMPIGSGQVHLYDLSAFIQQQKHVTRLRAISMLHTFQTEDGYVSRWVPVDDAAGHTNSGLSPRLSAQDQVFASAPWSVLIPAARHSVVIVEPTEEDRKIDPGIVNLSVGSDFVLGRTEEKKEGGAELRYFLVIPAHPEPGSLRR